MKTVEESQEMETKQETVGWILPQNTLIYQW